jgi:hypothetical protein
MNNYRLSLTISKNPEALGLSTKEVSLINAVHQATGASYGVCFLELVAEKWVLFEAMKNASRSMAGTQQAEAIA